VIYLDRRSLSQSRMLTGPTLTITYQSSVGIGRALCPRGTLLGRRTRSGEEGPTVEQYVVSYVKQLNAISDLSEIIKSLAKGQDHLTFLSYFSNQEDACPTHLLIYYLVHSAPRTFSDARSCTKVTDQYLMQLLGETI